MTVQCWNCTAYCDGGLCLACRILLNTTDVWVSPAENWAHVSRRSNIMIWADGRCCGCNVHRRRAFFAAISVIGLFVGFIALCMGNSLMAIAGFGNCVFWAIVGAVRPNGCCNEYSADGSSGMLTILDLKFYRWWFGSKVGCPGAAANPLEAPLAGSAMGVTVPPGQSYTPRAVSNIDRVKEIMLTMEGEMNPLDEDVDAFVANNYSPEVRITDAEGVVHGFDSVGDHIKRARAEGWRATDIKILYAKDTAVVHQYKLCGPTTALYNTGLVITTFTAFDAKGNVLSVDEAKKAQ